MGRYFQEYFSSSPGRLNFLQDESTQICIPAWACVCMCAFSPTHVNQHACTRYLLLSLQSGKFCACFLSNACRHTHTNTQLFALALRSGEFVLPPNAPEEAATNLITCSCEIKPRCGWVSLCVSLCTDIVCGMLMLENPH